MYQGFTKAKLCYIRQGRNGQLRKNLPQENIHLSQHVIKQKRDDFVKKILFAIKNMNIGGVEKSLLSLLNTIDKNKYEIDLLLLEKKEDF